MARNFRICAKEKNNRTLNIELFGDFDASSACELIDVLLAGCQKADKVAIDTDGLRTINAFGLDLVVPRISKITGRRADIEVTGRFSGAFQER